MKSMTESFLQDLARLLGPAHVTSDAQTLAALATASVKPAALCRPGSNEEVAAVVRLAGEKRVPVIPCGGWTAMNYGAPAREGALALSLLRLDRMLAYEPSDMVASAQAGMSFRAFQDALFEKGQWLPLDAPEAATLGGLVATDRSGPRRLAYGTLRDLVLGLTVVNGDGVLRKCGGRVVKNVTGYALERLYIGSLGTLGIITEVTVKLRPRPETASVQELTLPDFERGFNATRELALRLPFSAATASFPGKPYVAQLGIEASPPDHARILREIEAVAAKTGASLQETGATSVDADDWPARARRLRAIQLKSGETVEPPLAARLTWPTRAGDFPAQLRNLDPLALETGFGFLMAFLDFPGQVSVELFGEAEPETSTSTSTSTSTGTNTSTNTRTGGERTPDLDALVKQLRGDGLPATVVWKAGGQALTEPIWGPPRGEWALMREIKKTLDPPGILNAGRFIEGI